MSHAPTEIQIQGLQVSIHSMRSWDSLLTFMGPTIGTLDYVKQVRILKFSISRLRNIYSSVLSSAEGKISF